MPIYNPTVFEHSPSLWMKDYSIGSSSRGLGLRRSSFFALETKVLPGSDRFHQVSPSNHSENLVAISNK